MIRQRNILACVLPDLKNDEINQYCANLWAFSTRIDSAVHFLVSSRLQELQVSATPEFKRNAPVFDRLTEEWTLAKIDEVIQQFICDFIVVPSGEIGTGLGVSAEVRYDLFEKSSKPVLILSPGINLAKTPIESVLIPMSGEIRVSSALEFGLNLAKFIHVPVDLVHVIKDESPAFSSLETTGDQPHHEYRNLLDRVLAEASPFSGSQERNQVRTFYQLTGVPSVEILKIVKKISSCAVVSEWDGSLIHGKAETLKELLRQISMPFFLIKKKRDEKSVLKIGPESRVA